MLKEGLEFLFARGAESVVAKSLEIPGNKRLIVTQAGEKELDTDKPGLTARTTDVSDFIASVNDYGSERTVVWVSPDSVVAVVDDDDYREHKIVLALLKSEQYNKLSGLPGEFTQRQLVRMLKMSFDAPKLMASLRKVDFHRSSDGSRSLDHGSESLGKKVEATVQGIEQIPEEATLEVPFYATATLRELWPVKLRLDIDVDNEKFWLALAPNELSMLEHRALTLVYNRLTDGLETERVFIGSPA